MYFIKFLGFLSFISSSFPHRKHILCVISKLRCKLVSSTYNFITISIVCWNMVKVYFSNECIIVSPLSCVSSVPASCVHIWFVSCPCFMSLLVKYVPAVFVSLCVNYPVYISPVFWVWFRLVYSLLPGVSCLPCLALSGLKTIIWVYVLICVFLFLPRVCTVTIMSIYGKLKYWNLYVLKLGLQRGGIFWVHFQKPNFQHFQKVLKKNPGKFPDICIFHPFETLI